MKQLYQLYFSHAMSCYREDATDYILTLETLPDVLADKNFLEEYEYVLYGDIDCYSFLQPNYDGYIQVNITCKYGDVFEQVVVTLVPVKGFIL